MSTTLKLGRSLLESRLIWTRDLLRLRAIRLPAAQPMQSPKFSSIASNTVSLTKCTYPIYKSKWLCGSSLRSFASKSDKDDACKKSKKDKKKKKKNNKKKKRKGGKKKLKHPREGCEDMKQRCHPEKLAESKCMKQKKKEEKKPKNKFAGLWENPECCHDPCPEMLPRFDDMYWAPSNKAKRKYDQTWVECPRLKIAKRKVCCTEGLKFPKFKKRKRNQAKPKTACSVGKPDCKIMEHTTCKKIKVPPCRPVRNPPKCKNTRSLGKCKKICTPYPSFSECKRPRRKPKHPWECDCLDTPPMCILWAAWRKRVVKKKSKK